MNRIPDIKLRRLCTMALAACAALAAQAQGQPPRELQRAAVGVASPASAAAAMARPQRPLPAPAISPQKKQAAGHAVLLHHGIDFVETGKAASGVRPEAVAERQKLSDTLAAMRALDRLHHGPVTLYRRTFPTQSDPDTQAALDALKAQRLDATLTAGDALFNTMQRQLASGRCAQASEALDREELNVRTIGLDDAQAAPGSAAFWDSLARMNAPALSRYRDAAQAFGAACLDTRLDTLTVAQRAALDQVLGLLVIDGVPACMATRVRSDLALTARHCLYNFDDALGWQPRGYKSMEFVLAGRPDAKFALKVLDCRNPTADPACAEPPLDPVAADHLLLKIAQRKPAAGAMAGGIASPVLPPMPELLFEAAGARQFLVVPGYSTWFTGRAWSPADRPFATAAAVSGCIVESLSNACLINACQSDAGFSGAPILARRNADQLVVVGIFLGAATAYPSCKRTQHNFGAVLPGYVRRERLGEIGRGRL